MYDVLSNKIMLNRILNSYLMLLMVFFSELGLHRSGIVLNYRVTHRSLNDFRRSLCGHGLIQNLFITKKKLLLLTVINQIFCKIHHDDATASGI
jgi:hypothetical protein